MPFGDGIPKINSYSLTDFRDFDDCPFRFFVRHHLDRKYEIDESNPKIALGNLLDQSIKKFHAVSFYGRDTGELGGLVRSAAQDMKDEVEKSKLKGRPHFYAATIPFLTRETIDEAIELFKNYYEGIDKKIKPSLGKVDFCEWVIDGKEKFKLWGGPDTLERGDDGIPEVVDYKSRTGLAFNLGSQDYKSRSNIESGNVNIDMDLMPKIYTLLVSKRLQLMGYDKARFVVRFWQDPKNDSFYEEFDLKAISGEQFLFLQKIERIMRTFEFRPCGRRWCPACKSEKKDEFLRELELRGYKVISGEEFIHGN